MSSPITRTLSSATSPVLRRGVSNTSPHRSSSPTATATGQGLVRTPSTRQSRPVRKSLNRVSNSSPSAEVGMEEDKDMNNSTAQLLADLKEQVQRAEMASEQYRKQLEIMQKRFDDSANEQTAAEERDFQRQTEVDQLRAEVRESARQRREMELSHESEQRLLLQEREQRSKRESELQSVVSRLNEMLRAKNLERSSAGRTSQSSISDENSDPPLSSHSQSTEVLEHALQEKDNAIENLRLEIAEFYLKAAEEEHVGDGRLRALAKEILDVKMQNARLVEENESFQVLLSERTLKGAFLHESHVAEDSGISNMSTLAEELESVNDDGEITNDVHKRLEQENKSLKESNKALTLYIDKIIGRLLQHDGLEHIILDKDAPPNQPTKPMPATARPEKALPPTPASPGPGYMSFSSNAPPVPPKAGLLDRARSAVSKPGIRARPMSYAPPTSTKGHENPETAPSIPLTRGHRRAQSDQAQQDLSGTTLGQQLGRGSPLRSVSGGDMSPGVSPNRQSYFPAAPPSAHPAASGVRPPSGSLKTGGLDSSRNSVGSEASLEQDSNDSGSAATGSINTAAVTQPTTTNAVTKQNQLRPLRLVEQTLEDEEARKRANRGSWMGWFKGTAAEGQGDQ